MSRLLIAFLLVSILARGLFWLSGKLAPYGLAYDDGDTVILLGFGWQVIRRCWYWWLAGVLVLVSLVLFGYGLGSLENRWQRKRIRQLLKTLNDQSRRLAPFMDHPRMAHPPWSGRIAAAPLALLDTPDKDASDETSDEFLRYTKILRNLRRELGCSEEHFHRVMGPVLSRYAAYIHRLPASTGAYREPGGLLRQGLDNAVAVVRRGRETVLAYGFPGQQEKQKPQWLLACALAGLLTNVGKNLQKWTVSDPDDRHRWRPQQQPLTQWLAAHRLTEYCLRPVNNQDSPLDTLLAERILKPEGWLALDADIQTVLLDVLGGTSSHPLAALAREVYQHNRDQDRRSGQETSSPVPSEPASSSASIPEEHEAQPDQSTPVKTPTYESTTCQQAKHETCSDKRPPPTPEKRTRRDSPCTFPRRNP